MNGPDIPWYGASRADLNFPDLLPFDDTPQKECLRDTYAELIPVGRGGSAIVYRGVTADGRVDAVKTCDPRWFRDIPFFENEKIGSLLTGLRSACVSPVIRINRDPPFVIQTYVEGETLERSRDLLRRDTRYALAAVLDILTGLEELHRAGLFYGDLNPRNVMVRASGSSGVSGKCVLCDFSCADFCGNSFGERTIVYHECLSPEVHEGAPLDQRSDLFSAGVILNSLTLSLIPDAAKTGTADYFPGSRPVSFSAELPPDAPDADKRLEAIIIKAAQPAPRDRYQTAADMIRDLKSILPA